MSSDAKDLLAQKIAAMKKAHEAGKQTALGLEAELAAEEALTEEASSTVEQPTSTNQASDRYTGGV